MDALRHEIIWMINTPNRKVIHKVAGIKSSNADKTSLEPEANRHATDLAQVTDPTINVTEISEGY